MTLPAQLRKFADVAARHVHPVLLQGETGVGKTHLARRIHDLSPRCGKRFVSVNCAAIPRDLFEREMFGHVRGAFTGATEDRPGLFEAANGGTLFLDEVGELPLDIQPKLLRVLEEGSVRRLGSIENTRVDVRIITATNRDLWRLVQDKTFREDLYYRCCVLECQILPLRQCRAEIPALVHRLLARYAPAHGAPAEITQDAMERICSYEWPGNIRELGNALCQALVYSEGQAICVHHLPRRLQLSCGTGEDVCGEGGSRRCKYAAPEDVQQERRLILEALMAEGSNRTRAAKRLRMGRSTLWAKLKQYGIA